MFVAWCFARLMTSSEDLATATKKSAKATYDATKAATQTDDKTNSSKSYYVDCIGFTIFLQYLTVWFASAWYLILAGLVAVGWSTGKGYYDVVKGGLGALSGGGGGERNANANASLDDEGSGEVVGNSRIRKQKKQSRKQ